MQQLTILDTVFTVNFLSILLAQCFVDECYRRLIVKGENHNQVFSKNGRNAADLYYYCKFLGRE